MAESVHEALIDAAVARLEALLPTTLAGVKAVERRKSLQNCWDKNLLLPCLVVTPEGVEQEADGGDTCADADAYPLAVYTVVRGQVEDGAQIARSLKWRRLIKRAIRHKKFEAVPENFDNLFLPSPTIIPEALAYDLTVEPLYFQCLCTEVR